MRRGSEYNQLIAYRDVRHNPGERRNLHSDKEVHDCMGIKYTNKRLRKWRVMYGTVGVLFGGSIIRTPCSTRTTMFGQVSVRRTGTNKLC